jgi:diguanylate cyclase (GGDEF)-like protein/PAS domain S-box-containing protein
MDPNREHPRRAEQPAAGLQVLLELAELVRSGRELPDLLDAVARLVSETLRFGAVAIHLHLPGDDEDGYAVAAVHGSESLLDGASPGADPSAWRGESPSAWRADDLLRVPLHGRDGRRLGVIALDDPESGMRPDDQLLDVLGAVAAHVTQAIESDHQLAELHDALARERAVVETSLDAVISLDREGRVLEFNRAAELMFGYSGQRALGRELAELLIEPQDREAHRRGVQRAFEQGDGRAFHRRMEVTAVCADGRRLPVELSLSLASGAREQDAVIYGVARDISERLRGQQQLAYLAYHDRLTGLPNRVLVEDQLDLAVARARRMNRAVALLFVDLDDFKAVNDRLGHAAGDQFLAAVAARLRGVLRDTDVLARQGGDEFLVLLSDLEDHPEHVAEAVGAKLHVALQHPFSVAGAELMAAASVGVSLYPDDASDSEALLRHADAAMYKAKAAGGGQLAFHRSAEAIIARRSSVSAQLRRAIELSELELHYQPVWRLGAEPGVAAVEALLRWRHPERGLLTPDAFIALAEHSAVGGDLVDWVLQQACRDAARWREAGLHPRVCLNVSPHQLLASDFAARMQDALRSHELDPRSFVIELTESGWTVDATETLAALADLRAAGASLAIDDFGAGFSSLSRLHTLGVDVVKLDPVLLQGIPSDPRAVSMLRAIIDLARVGEVAIIAEGVEHGEQTEWLLANRIEHVQGYLFGHPLPAVELTPLLSRSLIGGGVRA